LLRWQRKDAQSGKVNAKRPVKGSCWSNFDRS
jgi:hypothetical protein